MAWEGDKDDKRTRRGSTGIHRWQDSMVQAGVYSLGNMHQYGLSRLVNMVRTKEIKKHNVSNSAHALDCGCEVIYMYKSTSTQILVRVKLICLAGSKEKRCPLPLLATENNSIIMMRGSVGTTPSTSPTPGIV